MLRRYGIHPRHRFGQNFLLNPRLLDFIIDQAQVAPGDHVLEVGPGSGALTRRLLTRGASVTAIEIDRDLSRLLLDTIGAGPEPFTLIQGDVIASGKALNPQLLAALPAGDAPLKLVANLPFSCGTTVVMSCLDGLAGMRRITVTLQLEVVDRFVAVPGSKAYGVVSVLSQLMGDVRKVKKVSRRAFWPEPKVDAAVLDIALPPSEARMSSEIYNHLKDIVQFAFQNRRKKLQSRLARRWPQLSQAILEPFDCRPDAVPPPRFMTLAHAVAPLNPEK